MTRLKRAILNAMTDRLKVLMSHAGFLLIITLVVQILAVPLWAASDISIESPTNPLLNACCENIDFEWGGHIKALGTVSWPHDESMYGLAGADTYYDGNIEGRLKNRLFYKDLIYLEAHYEIILSGGNTRRKQNELEKLYPLFFSNSRLLTSSIEDDRRFMDLTHAIAEDENHTLYHRLDRLSLTLTPGWGVISIGRQAVTWGNGLLFNPMDLFNPFSPTDIERDYKVGDDMISVRFPLAGMGDLQFLYVPMRDPLTGDVEKDQGSMAGKGHFAWGTTEFDLMVAKHYEDAVVGLGSAGYLRDAAWRLDVTYTFLEDDAAKEGFLAFVANMDYSWSWWRKNLYGFLEFYYTSLGSDDYGKAFADPDILERIDRGERFTLGYAYMGGNIQIELHPLFNAYLTVIHNLKDPSGIIQPRAVWNMAQDFQITFGGSVYYGESGTEYGGFQIPDMPFLVKTSNNLFLWLSYYF